MTSLYLFLFFFCFILIYFFFFFGFYFVGHIFTRKRTFLTSIFEWFCFISTFIKNNFFVAYNEAPSDLLLNFFFVLVFIINCYYYYFLIRRFYVLSLFSGKRERERDILDLFSVSVTLKSLWKIYFLPSDDSFRVYFWFLVVLRIS